MHTCLYVLCISLPWKAGEFHDHRNIIPAARSADAVMLIGTDLREKWRCSWNMNFAYFFLSKKFQTRSICRHRLKLSCRCSFQFLALDKVWMIKKKINGDFHIAEVLRESKPKPHSLWTKANRRQFDKNAHQHGWLHGRILFEFFRIENLLAAVNFNRKIDGINGHQAELLKFDWIQVNRSRSYSGLWKFHWAQEYPWWPLDRGNESHFRIIKPSYIPFCLVVLSLLLWRYLFEYERK